MLDGALYWSKCLHEPSNCHNRAGPHKVPTHKQKAKKIEDQRESGKQGCSRVATANQSGSKFYNVDRMNQWSESEAHLTDRNSHLFASLPNHSPHVYDRCTSQRLLIGHRIPETSNIVVHDPNSQVGANTASTSPPPNGSFDALRLRT